MFRTLVLKLLVKLFNKYNRDVIKMSVADEYDCLKFKNPEKTVKLLKSIITWCTLRHWEAKTQYERDVIKGYGLMAKMLLNGHKAVFAIESKIDNPDHQLKKWNLIRFNIFAGLLSRQPK